MITKTTLQVVLDILGTANNDIKGSIWVELIKLQLALKGLASAVDSLREKARIISAGQAVTYQTVGNINYALYLQDMTTVKVRAGAAIKPGSAVTFYPDGAGGIVAYNTQSGSPTPIDAYSNKAVSSGAIGDFVLKGLISYFVSPNSYTYDNGLSGDGTSNSYYDQSLQADASHHRLSNIYAYNVASPKAANGTLSYYTAWFFGYSDGKKVYRGPTLKYAGVRIGVIGPDYNHTTGTTLLIYFNPERK